MFRLLDYPLVALVVSFIVMLAAVRVGTHVLGRNRKLQPVERNDFEVELGATLTLLSLIIGFSFAMATSRYDQRKSLEQAEANAIGTEYLRVELLPPAEAARAKALLRDYLDQRVLFYTTRDHDRLGQINLATASLQRQLWTVVRNPAAADPSATTGLAVSGMNDVINSQGFTQAAWWNRIPVSAWTLMVAIAVCCHVLTGWGARQTKSENRLLLVLPVLVSISFFLIADIDAPRTGVIRVQPENLISLAQSLRRH